MRDELLTPLMSGAVVLALVAFIAVTCCDEAPAEWRREWPRTDFSRNAVPLDEIVSTGLPRDGIMAIDDPLFEPAAGMERPPAAVEPVLSVEIDGDARAYPLSILMWHEIVNDVVGGAPVAVTYCPLCNSGVIFRREVAGWATTFAVTGLLRHADLVMYDRATESWWQQFEGRAIVGELSGEELERVPSRLESFREFRQRHPDGLVLVADASASRDYGRNPYVGYDTSAMPLFYREEYDGPGSPLMRVVAVPGRDEAWSLDFLREVMAVEVDNLVIRWRPGQASALDAPRVEDGRDVGTVTVQRRRNGDLEDAVYSVPFAFAFRAFKPDAPIRHVE